MKSSVAVATPNAIAATPVSVETSVRAMMLPYSPSRSLLLYVGMLPFSKIFTDRMKAQLKEGR